MPGGSDRRVDCAGRMVSRCRIGIATEPSIGCLVSRAAAAVHRRPGGRTSRSPGRLRVGLWVRRRVRHLGDATATTPGRCRARIRICGAGSRAVLRPAGRRSRHWTAFQSCHPDAAAVWNIAPSTTLHWPRSAATDPPAKTVPCSTNSTNPCLPRGALLQAPVGVRRVVIRATHEHGVGAPSSRSLATASQPASPLSATPRGRQSVDMSSRGQMAVNRSADYDGGRCQSSSGHSPVMVPSIDTGTGSGSLT